MVARSLSTLESKLILRLEWDKQSVVTIEDVMHILHVSYDHARQILHRLRRDQWLALIKPGKYELIPAERGEHAFVDTNALFIGSALVEPYYFSFSTAAFFHGLSTQAVLTVYLATTNNRPRRMLVRNKEYRVVVQPAHKFFGWVDTNAFGSQVNMAEPEKAVLDCLDRPGYAGDLPEITAMLQRGKSKLDWEKTIEYATLFNSRVLLQRLGYLLDILKIPIDPELHNRLLNEATGVTKCYLGQPRRWHTGGDYNPTWRVIDNVPHQELIAEIQVR
jgi:predicted transcriptional regulator of viral defense system